MRKLLLSIVLFTGTVVPAAAQHVYQIRADSVRIYNVCDTAELIIENRTRGVSGYLYNKGNGRTEFRRIDLVQVGGSRLAIAGQDTIDLAQMSGVGGIDTIYRSGDNIRYVKQGVMRELYAPLAPADTSLTLQRITERGNTTTRDIVFNHSNGNPSNGLLWGYNTDYWKIFVESPQDTPAGNMVFEANDNGEEGWIFRSKSGSVAENILRMNRNRTELYGTLWHAPRTLNPENNTVNFLWNSFGGAHVTEDPEFRKGNNGLTVYNNIAGSTAVTITRSNDTLTERVPNTSGYHLRITSNNPTATTVVPALGGIKLEHLTKENTVYVTRFRALIPVGYYIFANHNNFGANASSVWLTSTAGTGKWEDYVQMYISGSSAAGSSFSTIAYYSLVGPLKTTTWYLGYYDFKISSGASWTENVRQNIQSGRPQSLWLENDSTKLSQGDQSALRVTTPFGFIDVGAQNATHAHFATDRGNFVFTKPVVATDKLGIYKNGPVSSSTTYLAQTEGRINGSPILTEASATGNYIQNQITAAQTASLWLNGHLKTNASFISKVGAGFAGFRLHNTNDVLRFGMGTQNAEGPQNSGSDFYIWRYADPGVTALPAMSIARTNGQTRFHGQLNMPQGSGILGTATGLAASSWFGFYDNANKRYGYIGKAAPGSGEIHVFSDSGSVILMPAGGRRLLVDSLQLNYNGGTALFSHPVANTLMFGNAGSAAPAFTTRSAGTKIVLSAGLSATAVDYGLGYEASNLWFSTANATTGFKWYAGTASIATLTGAGNLTATGNVTATAFYQSSLRSLKKDIRSFSASALEVLGKAKVRTFIFKSDSTGHRNIGFIADEVPGEMATPARNGVDQASTVGLLVKAVQELTAEKARLSSENSALSERLRKLELAMEQLLQQQK